MIKKYVKLNRRLNSERRKTLSKKKKFKNNKVLYNKIANDSDISWDKTLRKIKKNRGMESKI